jgi:hypothetical protein
MSVAPGYDEVGRPGYWASVGSTAAGGFAEVFIAAKEIESAVAEKLVINPTLDGPDLYLQFHSHGGGFEGRTDDSPVHSLGGLVTALLGQHDFQYDTPTEYGNAVLKLEKKLRKLHLTVFQRAREIGVIPDPMSPEYMPELTGRLRSLGVGD